jgi:uridine phosphorylase
LSVLPLQITEHNGGQIIISLYHYQFDFKLIFEQVYFEPMQRISETDLILNADGSIYHLNLLPGDVADTVITVGDPDRVSEISNHFDEIAFKKGKREFITHTGRIGNKRLTVISTGIGTDNIDIVFNELDALVNVDFNTRLVKPQLQSLNIIRIGTSGAVQADIDVDTLLVSEGAFGLDALMHYYKQDLDEDGVALLSAFTNTLPAAYGLEPYFAPASKQLLDRIAHDLPQGITITAPGFYAPQGRQVRAQSLTPQLMETIQQFSLNGSGALLTWKWKPRVYTDWLIV